MKELTIRAKTENLEKVQEFVREELKRCNVSARSRMKVELVVEELFVNIASYAYPSGEGDATVQVEVDVPAKSVSITFIDSGIPYNPVEKEDPDITLSAEERTLGGLGIFLAKQSTNEMKYQYEDNRNILTITKEVEIQ